MKVSQVLSLAGLLVSVTLVQAQSQSFGVNFAGDASTGARPVAVKQFGCRYEDILAVGPCVAVVEYLEQARDKSGI